MMTIGGCGCANCGGQVVARLPRGGTVGVAPGTMTIALGAADTTGAKVAGVVGGLFLVVAVAFAAAAAAKSP